MIKLFAIGNLGKDGTLNRVNDKNVINFSVASTERFKDAQGNLKDKTTWVDCAYWTEKMAILPHLKKGNLIYVEGTPDVRSYVSQEGKTGASLTLRVSTVQLLGAKGTDASETNPSSVSNISAISSSTPLSGVQGEDILPF